MTPGRRFKGNPGGDGEPRLRPLSPDEWPESIRELGLRVGPTGRPVGESNFLGTFARHEGIYRRWSAFALALLAHGSLPPRVRELMVLRTAWLCQGSFEWENHVAIAHDVGLSAAEVERVVVGPEDPEWNQDDAALLRCVDELHSLGSVTDATWERLAGQLDEVQLVEVPFLVGQYHLIAYVQNSLRIAPEPGRGEGLVAR
jgi:alkylhydroperoxidase family enzyme